ncbi:glutathione S-transferase [Sphingopyxis sp. H038]|uniref:glutathione S-transferase family protein n=1 Tax=unclassified Sphingopyxis TaxID=2614943 RepID=UPI00072FB1C6|nr:MULTISPECIES: glutathione S-transferase family protein [unclassified Sphingopyxis]KTE03463.1 glutathione S-transferase [Sphingopyxis sp. H012]KTE07969.1 glutathione S-transferase [Sphingopyxis sp. H053]KTE13931.1 glutathione S-transferase [Sphingopyxis sp. H093]KTE23509.1 glutathione S-transferase [Sphingopyxis sp. H080]KTE34245.1 glutathione S-transferase [Sphingopyxis sp. H038]
MTEDLIFYTNPMSRGQIVRWMLEEVGAPYEARILDYGTTMKGADYLAINPMGKVPAVVHDGKVVTECAAICAYLADAFPEAGLAPDAADRADYYRWLFFAAGPVEQAITAKQFGLEPDADQQRMAGFGSLPAALDALESAVADKAFVAGDRFSAADVYVGSQIDWGLQFGTIASRPAFEAYVAPLRTRAAYKRAKEIDNALIAEMQGAQ